MPVAAVAHDGFVGVILEPDRVSPGGVVVVRGDNIATDSQLVVSLSSGTTRTDIGTVMTDGEGHFAVEIHLPVELAAGSYTIEASDASGSGMRATLSVEGSAIHDPADGAPPGRDEGGPVAPTAAAPAPAAVAPTGSPVVVMRPLAASTVASPPSPADVDVVPFVALAGAIGALGFLVWRTRRPPTAPAGSADLP